MRFYLLHFLQSYCRDEVKIVLLVIFPMFGVYRPCHDRGGSFISAVALLLGRLNRCGGFRI